MGVCFVRVFVTFLSLCVATFSLSFQWKLATLLLSPDEPSGARGVEEDFQLSWVGLLIKSLH